MKKWANFWKERLLISPPPEEEEIMQPWGGYQSFCWFFFMEFYIIFILLVWHPMPSPLPHLSQTKTKKMLFKIQHKPIQPQHLSPHPPLLYQRMINHCARYGSRISSLCYLTLSPFTTLPLLVIKLVLRLRNQMKMRRRRVRGKRWWSWRMGRSWSWRSYMRI